MGRLRFPLITFMAINADNGTPFARELKYDPGGKASEQRTGCVCGGPLKFFRACGPGSTFPSGAVQTTVITMHEALRLAKIYNPQFQTAATNAAVARENRHQAWAARLPP